MLLIAVPDVFKGFKNKPTNPVKFRSIPRSSPNPFATTEA